MCFKVHVKAIEDQFGMQHTPHTQKMRSVFCFTKVFAPYSHTGIVYRIKPRVAVFGQKMDVAFVSDLFLSCMFLLFVVLFCFSCFFSCLDDRGRSFPLPCFRCSSSSIGG